MKQWSVMLECGTGAPHEFTIAASNLRTALYRAGKKVSELGQRQAIPLGGGSLPPRGLALRITVRRLD